MRSLWDYLFGLSAEAWFLNIFWRIASNQMQAFRRNRDAKLLRQRGALELLIDIFISVYWGIVSFLVSPWASLMGAYSGVALSDVHIY